MKKTSKKQKIETIIEILEETKELAITWINRNEVKDSDGPFNVCFVALLEVMNEFTGKRHFIKISDKPFKEKSKIILK